PVGLLSGQGAQSGLRGSRTRGVARGRQGATSRIRREEGALHGGAEGDRGEGAGEGEGTRREADRIRPLAPRAPRLRERRSDLSGIDRARGRRGPDAEPGRLARLSPARRRRSRAPRGDPGTVSTW